MNRIEVFLVFLLAIINDLVMIKIYLNQIRIDSKKTYA